MKKPIASTKARAENNEDFYYDFSVGETNVMVVGDFARTQYGGVDELAKTLLQGILETSRVDEIAPPISLVQIASELNNRLLSYQKGYGHSFQCCAVFTIIENDQLFYLPVGDCRIGVYRNKSLILLNETIWNDDSGNILPPLVTSDKKVKRGNEEPPDLALGVKQLKFTTTDVKNFQLQSADIVILYSDGVDKFVSPVKLLELLGNARESEARQKALADEIINEVGLARGDDDRSVMIAFGPHSSKEVKAKQEMLNQQGINMTRLNEAIDVKIKGIKEEMSKKIIHLDGQIKQLEKLESDIVDLKQVADDILNKDDAAKITDSVITALREKDTVNPADQLGDILKTFEQMLGTASKEILEAVSRQQRQNPLESTTGAEDLAGYISYSEAHSEEIGEARHEDVQEEKSNLETAQNGGQAQDKEFFVWKENSAGREGVLKITPSRYELLDENQAFPSEPVEDEYYLFSGKDDSPGALTGFHLFLRSRADLIERDWKNAVQLKNQILKLQDEFLEKYKDKDFNEAKKLHWQIRDEYAKPALRAKKYEDLVNAERLLATDIFRTDNQPAGPDAFVTKTRYEKLKDNLAIKIAASIIGLIVLVIITGAAVYGVMWLISLLSTNNTSQLPVISSAPKAGGDGRSVYFNNVKLDYRIRAGKEDVANDFMGNISAQNKEDAENELKKKTDLFILSNPPKGHKYASVDISDVPEASKSGSDTEEICRMFLKRVSPLVSIETLKELNPELICRDLKGGEELLLPDVPGTQITPRPPAPAKPAKKKIKAK